MRVHPFPFRTRKLSSLAPKILVWRRTGKIGNANTGNRTVNRLSCFFVQNGAGAFYGSRLSLFSEMIDQATEQPFLLRRCCRLLRWCGRLCWGCRLCWGDRLCRSYRLRRCCPWLGCRCALTGQCGTGIAELLADFGVLKDRELLSPAVSGKGFHRRSAASAFQ